MTHLDAPLGYSAIRSSCHAAQRRCRFGGVRVLIVSQVPISREAVARDISPSMVSAAASAPGRSPCLARMMAIPSRTAFLRNGASMWVTVAIAPFTLPKCACVSAMRVNTPFRLIAAEISVAVCTASVRSGRHPRVARRRWSPSRRSSLFRQQSCSPC
jgi:hypothetical protein